MWGRPPCLLFVCLPLRIKAGLPRCARNDKKPAGTPALQRRRCYRNAEGAKQANACLYFEANVYRI